MIKIVDRSVGRSARLGVVGVWLALTLGDGLADTLAVQLAAVPTLSESLSLVDSTAGVMLTDQAASESLTLTDSATADVGLTPAVTSDTLTLTDTLAVQLAAVPTLSETLTLTDSATATLAAVATVSDALTLTDVTTAVGSGDKFATYIYVKSATIGVPKATGTIIA